MESRSVQKRVTLLVGLSLLSVGCGNETVVHDIDEREANRIIETLADNQISANKLMRDTGRNVFYGISVPAGKKLDAIRVLNQNELPRRKDMGYTEVFKESGLIPTSAEERAKEMAALEGEIERQLKLIDGVLDAQVQIVRPEESALRTTGEAMPTTTASVTIRYLPGDNGAKPLSEPQIRSVVAAGVERLTPDNVVVLMTPVRSAHSGTVRGPSTTLSPKQVTAMAYAAAGVILLMGLGLIFSQMRLRVVRGRLVRLQNEIAKARRKPADSTANSASSSSTSTAPTAS
jgi:type III secretion protein J